MGDNRIGSQEIGIESMHRIIVPPLLDGGEMQILRPGWGWDGTWIDLNEGEKLTVGM